MSASLWLKRCQLGQSMNNLIPEGWALVPIQPTPEMLKAVDDEAEDKHLARGRAISAWGLMLDAAPAAEFKANQSAMRDMATAPRDGSRILIKTNVSHYSRGWPHFGYHVVGTSWGECWFVDGKFQRWCGDDRTRSTGGIDPLGWAPLPLDAGGVPPCA